MIDINAVAEFEVPVQKKSSSKFPHWPLSFSLLTLWIIIGFIFINSINLMGVNFHIGYTLDDAYIHMAVAKNLAEHGVWGVSSYSFSSCTSSLLWPLILALDYKLFGPNDYTPFVLNFLFASLIVVTAYWIMYRNKVHNLVNFLVLIGIILYTPLPTLVYIGMEHTLQGLCFLIFFFQSVKFCKNDSKFNWKSFDTGLWFLLALLLSAVRYEGIFLVGLVSLLQLLKRRWLVGISLLSLNILPLVVFGLISVSNGAYWLPNSVLLKGHSPEFTVEYITKALGFIRLDYATTTLYLAAPHIFLLSIISLVLYIWRYNRGNYFWEENQIALVLFLGITFLHMELADITSYYRYDSYLIILGLVTIANATNRKTFPNLDLGKLTVNTLPKYAAILILIFLVLLPSNERALGAIVQNPRANTNIFDQQYQMALFLKKYYSGQSIIVNDIGAVNFYADINTTDIGGLGTNEVARLIKDRKFSAQTVAQLAIDKGVKIAVVYNPLPSFYDNFNGQVIPETWKETGHWITPKKIVLGADTVYFYAVDPKAASELSLNLKEFSSSLPKDVEWVVNPG